MTDIHVEATTTWSGLLKTPTWYISSFTAVEHCYSNQNQSIVSWLAASFSSWVNHVCHPSNDPWWWWLKCLALLSVGTVEADRPWGDIANMDRPYILIPEFSLHDQRWLWCPMGSNHRSSIERLRWCCPCLHKQTKLKAMSKPIGLGILCAKLSESWHPSNVGDITDIPSFCFLSMLAKSFHPCKTISSQLVQVWISQTSF